MIWSNLCVEHRGSWRLEAETGVHLSPDRTRPGSLQQFKVATGNEDEIKGFFPDDKTNDVLLRERIQLKSGVQLHEVQTFVFFLQV